MNREERDEVERVATLMEQMNKNLEAVGEFRKRFNDVLDNVHLRIEDLEAKIKDIPQTGTTFNNAEWEERLKKAEKEIEMIEKTIENMETKEHIHTDLQESINKVEHLANEDNKFIEGLYIEFKNHIENNDEKIKEIEKKIAKTSQDNEKTNRFRLAFRNFIKAVMED